MKLHQVLPELGAELLLAPVRGWLPLVLPAAVLVAALTILGLYAGPTAAEKDPGAPAPQTRGKFTGIAAGAGLLEQALTASGLRQLDDSAPLLDAGSWLSLPAGPYLTRLLEPEPRVGLGLRGRPDNGGTCVLPVAGPQFLQLAIPAAEDQLRRRRPGPGLEING